MNDKGVCRTAPGTLDLLNIGRAYMKIPPTKHDVPPTICSSPFYQDDHYRTAYLSCPVKTLFSLCLAKGQVGKDGLVVCAWPPIGTEYIVTVVDTTYIPVHPNLYSFAHVQTRLLTLIPKAAKYVFCQGEVVWGNTVRVAEPSANSCGAHGWPLKLITYRCTSIYCTEHTIHCTICIL